MLSPVTLLEFAPTATRRRSALRTRGSSVAVSRAYVARWRFCAQQVDLRIRSMIRRDIDNTPEADMARRGINRLGNTCRRAITQAVIRRAEEGPAFEHFSWDADLWLCRINTLLSCPPSRIDRDAARPGRVCWMPLLVPVRRPFPHIARHVIQPIAIRWEGAHGRRPFIAICHQVLPGELPLPGVGHQLATRSEFIPPGIDGTLYSPACSTFPRRSSDLGSSFPVHA